MNINIDDVEAFINSQNLDIRIKGNSPRFADQKCTPDVLSFIAEMALHLGEHKFFRNDIWKNQEFEKIVPIIYNKPDPSNESAKNEYDKFIDQNLQLLSYAGILNRQKNGRTHCYKIIESKILEYVGQNDRHAFLFLTAYFKKMLSDSDFLKHFDLFFQRQDKQTFQTAKEDFRKFMLINTKIGSRSSKVGGRQEINRIFPKVLNLLAVNNSKGTIKGHLSKGIMTYSELMYNRENFRDIDKEKTETREESEIRRGQEIDDNQIIKNAKKIVRDLHSTSEVHDNMQGKTGHIHHIFPKSDFSSISNYKENLIALTAGQHLQKAHPNGNTHAIDATYQQICLKAKLSTIKKNPQHYSKESFIHVINVGFGWLGNNKELSTNTSFTEIESAINENYRHL